MAEYSFTGVSEGCEMLLEGQLLMTDHHERSHNKSQMPLLERN